MDTVKEENETDLRLSGVHDSKATLATTVDDSSTACSSDEEDSVATHRRMAPFSAPGVGGHLVNPAALYARNDTSVGTFGEIKIENSQDVHFGNKIFTAPITVVSSGGDEENDKFGILENNNCWSSFKKQLKSSSKNERIAMGAFVSVLLLFTIISIYFGSQIVTSALETESTTDSGTTSAPYDCLVPRVQWFVGVKPDTPDVKKGLSLAVITHTASPGCNNSAACVDAASNTYTHHHNILGYTDLAYNFLVGGDGYVYEGRGWGKEGAHTRGWNKDSVGIAFIGLYHNTFARYNTPTPNQIRCTRHLLDEGVKLGWLAQNYSLVGHCDLRGGLPPGNVLMKEIRTWSSYRKEGNPEKCDE